MMATTHVFVGLLIAMPAVLLFPEQAPAIALAGMVGGLFPDFDIVADHRKTLHYPVYYSALAVGAGIVALLAPGVLTVAVAVFLFAAAAHAVSDAFGGGVDFRPWKSETYRGVYVHPAGRWEHPRGWIRYDGAPEDFMLGAILAVPGILFFSGSVQVIVVAGLAISFVYTVIRKPLGRHLAAN